MATKQKVIDMRSDTVTKPTAEMRSAMMAAEVGDDVYQEDPTVNKLQEKMASLLNKESALFFPSGTMSNLTCIMAHASQRGSEVLVGDKSHIANWEQGNISTIGGVFAHQIKNNKDGTLDLHELRSSIYTGQDNHNCLTKAIALENTHNFCCGAPLSLEYIEQVSCIAKSNGIKLHIDGARLFNAATALGIHPSEIVKNADSVSVCLSKGLGAPVGSLVSGSKEFIQQCGRIRKSLGGGMRQVGVLAAAGIVAIDTIAPLLYKDHDNAQHLANGLYKLRDHGISIDISTVRTNMVMFNIKRDDLSADRFCELLDNPVDSSEAPVVKIAKQSNIIRVVVHHQVTRDDINLALERISDILKEKY